jgi:uncharacterized membrane protein YeaQ/YmgE (transglycosylase-associated protein family)
MTNSTSNAQSPVYAIYVSCVAALGGLLFGYDTAVIAGTVEFLQKRFSLSDLALGWTVSSALVGCVAGAWLAGKWGQCANLDRVQLCPIFAACHGACVSNFPAHFTT